MKCLFCGIFGILQKRGNSYRIQHYIGFEKGKRVYAYHAVDKRIIELVEVNGSKKQ